MLCRNQLVKGIGESKSKQEEDTIVLAEVQVLRRKLQEKNIDPKTVRRMCLGSLLIYAFACLCFRGTVT